MPNRRELAITKYYGLNTTTAPVNLTYEATILENLLIRNLGKLTVREGSTLLGNDTGNYRQLGLTHWVSGATKVQIKVENTLIQKLSTTWSTMSGAGATGLTADKDMNFCFANGYLYGFNATDAVRKINDTTVTTVAGIPVGSWAIWWRNYMFVGGVAAYPNRVYFSNLSDPETYSVNDWFDIEPGDGDSLTGGIALKDKILFAKSRAWYYMTGSGTNTFAIYPITYDFGACSYRSIINFGNDIWCVDMEGRIRSVLRNQYGLFNGQDMSEDLNGTLATINKSELHNVCAGEKDGYLLFAVPTGSATTNTMILCYDNDAPVANGKSKWSTFTGWYPSVFDSFDEQLYFGEGRADGKVYSWSGNTDNGTAIACHWRGAQLEIDSEGQKKRFLMLKWFAFPLGNYNATITASIDEQSFGTLGSFNLSPTSPLWGDVGAVWGTGVWGVTGAIRDTFHYSTGGRVIGTKVQNDLVYGSSNGQAEFGTHSIYYEVKRFRPE